MTATKVDRALHIPPHVLRLAGATLVAKCVMGEVLDLYKVSGHVFAGDDHFADRFGIGKRTVGEAIKWLVDEQHLSRIVNNKLRSKRVLIPSEYMVSGIRPADYATHQSAINPDIVIADSATTMSESMQNPHGVDADSATSGSEIRNECMRISHGVDADSAYINTTLNTTLNTTSNTTLKSEGAAAAASQPEKKIGGADEVENLPTAESNASASHTGGARRKKPDQEPAPDLIMPAWATDTFTQAWAQWLAYRQAPPRKKLQPASVQLLLNRLADFDEGFCLMLFTDAITNGWQGLIFDSTPAKYEIYKQHQITPLDPTQHGISKPTFGSKPAAGRRQFDLNKMRAINAHLSGNEQHGGV